MIYQQILKICWECIRKEPLNLQFCRPLWESYGDTRLESFLRISIL